MSIDEYVTCTGWFKVLMTEFKVVSGRKDGVDLVMIYRHVVIFFVAWFGQEKRYFALKQDLPM